MTCSSSPNSKRRRAWDRGGRPHTPARRPSHEASSPESGLSNLLRELRQSNGNVALPHRSVNRPRLFRLFDVRPPLRGRRRSVNIATASSGGRAEAVERQRDVRQAASNERGPEDVLCPWCGDRHVRATEILGSGSPDDGDATICWTCTNIAVFDSSVIGGLRKQTTSKPKPAAQHSARSGESGAGTRSRRDRQSLRTDIVSNRPKNSTAAPYYSARSFAFQVPYGHQCSEGGPPCVGDAIEIASVHV